MSNEKTAAPIEGRNAGGEMITASKNVALTIGGESIIVRKFSALEETEAETIVRPIFAELSAQLPKGIEPEVLDELIGQHRENWIALIAFSTGKSKEWITGLSDNDGIALPLAFWGVNGDFLTRELLRAAARTRRGDQVIAARSQSKTRERRG